VNARIIFSQFNLVLAAVVGIVLITTSYNVRLWLIALGVLFVAAVPAFGQKRIYPALLWVIGFNWIAIATAILGADLRGLGLAELPFGVYRVQAVNLSLIALIAFAFGIVVCTRFGRSSAVLERDRAAATVDPVLNLQSCVAAYFASLVVAEIAAFVVSTIPQLQQPLIVLYMLKFVFIYLIAVAVFTSGRGYLWLIAVLGFEVVNGLTSFFGTFKESFFLVLIAIVATGLRPSVRMWAFGVASAILLVVLSLLWTAVKPEYRNWVSGYTGEQIVARDFNERVDWMADHMVSSDIDYWKALYGMVERVDSTHIVAQFLLRDDQGYLIDLPSRYLGGIEHVLMPRILFPDKPILDDSAITSAMTGRVIDANTSISIGYIAEARYDFGPTWMFVPIFLIGMTLGLAGRYFMTRRAPFIIRQAFATTALFNFFQFGINFNKALGGFLVGFMVLALLLKFGYPLISGWLFYRRPTSADLVGLSAAE
jgi:hypothetical protein